MTPGKNRRKRDFANADVAYAKLSRTLAELREAALVVGPALLEPAIDAMCDRVDEAERVRENAHLLCVEAGIVKAYGRRVVPYRWEKDDEEEPDYVDDAA